MDSPHYRRALRLIACSMLPILPTFVSTAEAWHAVRQSEDVDAYPDVIDRGLVWIDGRFVPPPYRLTSSQDSVKVNDIAWTPSAEELEDIQRDVLESGPGSRLSESPIEHAARRMAGWLNTDGMIIAFNGLPTLSVPRGDREHHMCSALCSDKTSEAQLSHVLRMAPNKELKERLRGWIANPELTASLRSELESRIEQVEQADQNNRRGAAAVRRLQSLSYPLTVVGMLLGVLGLGHMLKWSGLQAVQSEKPLECVRAAELGLVLMLGMAIIDLIWTVLAGQAGAMTELNPLGSRFIHSPVTLAVFKVLATGLGCGILYSWRHRQQMQQATWWMCLVCILLTFRWVVVDSLGV